MKDKYIKSLMFNKKKKNKYRQDYKYIVVNLYSVK